MNENTIDTTNNSFHNYVVVLRSPSAVVFLPGDFLRVNVPSERGTTIVTIQTRYQNIGLQHPLPGHLWVDCRGPAKSIEEAVSIFGNVAGSIIPIIAFSTNAAIDELEPELVFDNTANINVRDFLQSMLADERPPLRSGRKVDIDITKTLMVKIESHSEKERITRAILQYHLALRHWRWGHETLATAHLFMGMEALTKAVARVRQKLSGLSEAEFAHQLGIDLSSLSSRDRITTIIEAVVRRSILFQGDDECRKEAKAASDGFEHGFMPYDEIRLHARKVRDKTASYLRQAIVGLLDIEQRYYQQLFSEPYNDPLGHWPIVKYIRGQLLGSSSQLAADGNVYPIMNWASTLKSVEMNDKGDFQINSEDNLTAKLGEGISFQPHSFEVWKP
jgi:hypothetical protein